jgi:tetratricopeptide (TPR) repeat protein
MSAARRELGDPDYSALDGNWLTWVALRHFLPTMSLRLLALVVARRIGGADLLLSDLFEEEVVGSTGVAHADGWLLRGRATKPENNELEYLRDRIRKWAMHSDSEAFTGEDPKSEAAFTLVANALEKACQLGSLDFNSLQGQLLKVDAHGDLAIKNLDELLSAGALQSTHAAIEDFESRFSKTSRPLNAVIAKHVGDLYADLDDWECASRFYELALELLGGQKSEVLGDVADVLRDLTLQSLATAGWIQVGPGRAAELLGPATDRGTLSYRPILKFNAVPTLSHARMLEADTFKYPPDLRGVLMAPPQLSSSFDLGAALSYAVEKNFSSANRLFWSVLRRQQALGLFYETRDSKFCYGHALLAELCETPENQRSPVTFELAVRLLIESEEASGTEKMTWAPELIRRFVSVDLVRAVQARADRYAGVKTMRNRTAMELFRHWIAHAGANNEDAVQLMLEIIVEHARSSPVDFFSNRDVGTRAFEILNVLGGRGLGINPAVAKKFVDAFTTRMATQGAWNAKRHAMQAAPDFMNDLDGGDLALVIESTLAHLAQVNPSANAWHIVQPALRLLVSRASARLVRENADIGERVLTTILNFGVGQGTENSALLFYLRELNSDLFHDPRVIAAVRPTLETVRDSFKENSSAITHNIQSIFIAPSISGRKLIADAVAMLRRVIASVPGRNGSLSFPVAYSAILQIAQQKAALANVADVSEGLINEWFAGLFDEVSLMWGRAKSNAMIFASFAIPVPSSPSQVIVHNWAFASMRLADAVGRVVEMKQAIDDARSQPHLKAGIEMGIALSEVSEDKSAFNPSEDETGEVFYARLGKRLVHIGSLKPETAGPFYLALLTECFRHGPNGMDAAPMLAVLDRKLDDVPRDETLKRYVLRLEANRELRLLLMPLVDALLPGLPGSLL